MADTERWVRASGATWIAARDTLELVTPSGAVQRLSGETAALAEAILAFAQTPRTTAEMLAHVEAESGAPLGAGAGVVSQLIDVLRAAGALVRPLAPIAPVVGRVVVAMGGAVAAAHAPLFVQLLLARGLEVRVVATENALRFTSREALEALTHAPVRSSLWPADGMDGPAPHVSLAAWADLVVVWPATATTISRLATGDCSELVSAVAITTRAPVLVAPSMNEAMLDAASVARNLETLRADRFRITASTLAHEVAEAPTERRPVGGGAPDATTLARMVEAILRTSVPEPHDAASWEAFHRRVPESEQAWVGPADPVVMAAIERHGGGGSLWDVGTGHGAIALAAAAAGYRVVASDASDTAVRRAAARDPEGRVSWIVDDVLDSAIRGTMDVIVDRGTLHVLPVGARPAYARAVTARTRPGSVVIVTTHAPPGDPRVRSHPTSAADVAALFGDTFEALASVPGTFTGRLDPAPASVTTVLRRIR